VSSRATRKLTKTRATPIQGDLDRAIADETKAIEIDPKSAAAYASRGNANTRDTE
jgi:TPR repeat